MYHQGGTSARNLPPYKLLPPHDYGPANPAMPTQYQPQYTPYGVMPSQGPVVQAPVSSNTTVIVAAQPTHELDYLGYSIFTMLCCCLPLGIAALVFSIQTRNANDLGNRRAARQNSRMAWILANTALAVGLVVIIMGAVLVATKPGDTLILGIPLNESVIDDY